MISSLSIYKFAILLVVTYVMQYHIWQQASRSPSSKKTQLAYVGNWSNGPYVKMWYVDMSKRFVYVSILNTWSGDICKEISGHILNEISKNIAERYFLSTSLKKKIFEDLEWHKKEKRKINEIRYSCTLSQKDSLFPPELSFHSPPLTNTKVLECGIYVRLYQSHPENGTRWSRFTNQVRAIWRLIH